MHAQRYDYSSEWFNVRSRGTSAVSLGLRQITHVLECRSQECESIIGGLLFINEEIKVPLLMAVRNIVEAKKIHVSLCSWG